MLRLAQYTEAKATFARVVLFFLGTKLSAVEHGGCHAKWCRGAVSVIACFVNCRLRKRLQAYGAITDAQHTMDPHHPVCFGVDVLLLAGSD